MRRLKRRSTRPLPKTAQTTADERGKTAPESALSRLRRLFRPVAVIVAAMLVPMALWGWVAVETRANALATALTDQRHATEALGEHTLKLLEAQAFAIDLVDREAGERDCPALRSDPHTQDLMRLAAQSPQTESLWIIDANGFTCMVSDPALMDTRYRSFRDYFSGAQKAPPGRLYVDRAVIGLVDFLPAFNVVKARRKNGAFNGIVLASVSLTGLVKYWQKVIDALPTQRMALFREDGATIARSWQPLVSAADPTTDRRIAAFWQTAPDGTTLENSAIDGARRVGAWHSLPDWGVVVSSSVDQAAVLAPWHRSTLINGLVAMVVSGLLGALTRSLLRERQTLTRTVEERTGMLEAALASMADAVLISTNDGNFIHINDAFVTYHRFADKSEAVRLLAAYPAFFEAFTQTGEPVPFDQWPVSRALRGETGVAVVIRVRRKDTGESWLGSYNFAPIRDRHGTIAGAVVTGRDITERKRTEKALVASQATLEAALASMTDAVFISTNDGNFIHVNDAFVTFHRFPNKSEAVRLLPGYPEFLEAFTETGEPIPVDQWPVNRAIRGETGVEAAILVRRKDTGEHWFASFNFAPIRDGHGTVIGVVLAARDITARRQAEANMLRTTALLKAVGNCSPDPIYAKDTEGRFLFANPAVLAVIGKTADEVIGRTDAEWHHDPAQAAVVMANDRRIIETGQVERLEETFDVARAGTRVFRSAKAPLQTEDGSVLGVVAVSSDITQLKQAEAKLRRLTKTLEARVQEETAAREAAQARAAHAERMQALGQLAGGIAHDFNNVLQAVEGAALMIEQRAGDATGVRRLARLAIEAAGRGASITRRLLAFGRRGDLRTEALDVAALLSDMHEIFSHSLGVTIDVHIRQGTGLSPLLADKGQLETVLVNLATNARDAMPEGGRLTLSADTEVVSSGNSWHRSGLAPGRYVRLTVADTGIGMDAATLARVDEPFFTTKDVGIGTGLGLPMAKGFAEQSGGALHIESSPGNGTTVTLWLPAADERHARAARDLEAADVAASGIGKVPTLVRVLLVDDEDMVREMLAEHLEDAGYGVVSAGGGIQALALLVAGEAVDILVTDLSMPGMDGLAVIRAAQERRPDLPAVLLTGYAGDGAAVAVGGAISGAFSLLRKPIQIQELTDRMEALLALRKNDA